MSDQVECEHCGLAGKRRNAHIAPEGWYFGAFTLGPDGDHSPGDLLIVHACSESCRDALWTKMAGHRWDTIERRVDVPAELRRAADLHAERLREEARRLTDSNYPCGRGADAYAAPAFARILERAAAALDRETEAEINALAMAKAKTAGSEETALPTSDPKETLPP